MSDPAILAPEILRLSGQNDVQTLADGAICPSDTRSSSDASAQISKISGPIIIQCNSAHAGDWHKIDRRAARHHDSDALRVALGHWRADIVEAFDDVGVPPRSHWW